MYHFIYICITRFEHDLRLVEIYIIPKDIQECYWLLSQLR